MLVVLDKDGTLIRTKSGEKFVNKYDDQVLFEGVTRRLINFKQHGANLVIASNQGGVAAGKKTLDEAILEMSFCLDLIPQVEYALCCPDFDGVDCWQGFRGGSPILHKNQQWQFRKPAPGMLLFASENVVGRKLMIGDRPEDLQAAQAANFDFLDAEQWRSS